MQLCSIKLDVKVTNNKVGSGSGGGGHGLPRSPGVCLYGLHKLTKTGQDTYFMPDMPQLKKTYPLA
jgi:hypothetical protein